MYAAPEVYKRCYSCEADLWSCGMVLYQLLVGRMPFWMNPRMLSKEQVGAPGAARQRRPLLLDV